MTSTTPGLYGEDDSESITQPSFIDDTISTTDTTNNLTLKEVYETCFNSYPQPVICLRKDTKLIELWNKAAEVSFGYRKEEVIGQSITLLFPAGMMSSAEHDIRVEKFSNSKRSESVFGTKRKLKAKSRNGTEIPIIVTTFKIEIENSELIGGVISDVSVEQRLIDQLSEKNDSLAKIDKEIRTKNETLQEFNKNLLEAKQSAEFRMARARSQDRLANRLMFSIITIIAGTVVLSSFTRVPETSLSFVKDSALLLLGILSGAIGGIFGSSTKDDKGVVNSTTYQGPGFPEAQPLPTTQSAMPSSIQAGGQRLGTRSETTLQSASRNERGYSGRSAIDSPDVPTDEDLYY